MNILQAFTDRRLFGALPSFRDLHSWRRWLTFIKAVYGFPLDQEELADFRKFTGRTGPRPGGYPEAAAITGRQSGKSRITGSLAAAEGSTTKMRGAFSLMLAQDQRAALRTLLAYAREPFQVVPAYTRELVRETGDTLELRSGVSLAAYPCRPAAVRGIRSVFAALDELAFMRSTENLPVDREMLRAVRPCLAMTGGRLIILSSPYGQSGALWDLHRQHYGRDESETLIWQASAPEMNPTLPADYLARMERDDPDAYRSEVLGEFRAGVASLFDPDAIEACIIPRRRELPPMAETLYHAFGDPSGGRGDPFTVAVGHVAAPRAVVDVMRAWKPPFDPSTVVAEAAALLKTYRVQQITGDKYAGEWPREAFRAHGITYQVAEHTKSDLYLSLLTAVNAGRVELLDIPELLRELRGLERRRGPSGRDRVDHPAAGGHHDDRANSVAGLVHLLIGEAERPELYFVGGATVQQTEAEIAAECAADRARAIEVVQDSIRRTGMYWPGE